MIFMFNTNNSCPYSYVQLNYNSSIHKFRCKEKRLETTENGTVEFVHYVQSCDVYVEEQY